MISSSSNAHLPLLPGNKVLAIVDPNGGGFDPTHVAFILSNPARLLVLLAVKVGDLHIHSKQQDHKWIKETLDGFEHHITDVAIIDNLGLEHEHISSYLQAKWENVGNTTFSRLTMHREPQSDLERMAKEVFVQ